MNAFLCKKWCYFQSFIEMQPTICRSWSHFFASRIFCYILFADLVIKWFCFLILKTFVNINHWDCWKIRSFFNRSSSFPSPAQSIVSISKAFGIQFNVYFFLPENSFHSKEGFFHPFFLSLLYQKFKIPPVYTIWMCVHTFHDCSRGKGNSRNYFWLRCVLFFVAFYLRCNFIAFLCVCVCETAATATTTTVIWIGIFIRILFGIHHLILQKVHVKNKNWRDNPKTIQ